MSSTVLTHASSRTRSQQLLVTLGSVLMTPVIARVSPATDSLRSTRACSNEY